MSQSSSGTSAPTAGLGGGNPPPGATGSTGMTFFGNSAGPTTAPSTGGGTGTPLISQDQSAFSQYVLGQTGGYAVTIGNIPGVSQSGPTTIGTALQDFMDLPPAQLQQLEMQLWDAGFYIDSNGQPMNAQDIRFGVPGDPASWTAFARALGAAASSGQSLTNLLQTRANQGAGVNNSLPSPVTGGAHTYTIDLSNPTQVKYVADQIFQAALGRNANASEVADITSKLSAQETKRGLAQEQGSEQQSRAVYQTGVNQRNIAYENATNPNLGGQIPQGPFSNPQEWATALLTYMNLPVTTSNVAAISAWAAKTGKFSDGSYNPLGTERPEGGSQSGPTGAQQFQNWAQGLQGTASMLMNGKYQALLGALQGGNASDAVANDPQVKQELKGWSNGAISSLAPDSSTTQDAAAQVAVYQQQQAPAVTQNASPSQPDPGIQTAETNTNAMPNTGITGTAQSMGAEGGGPNGATGGGPTGTVSPSNVSQGQQPPNPGDAYINPVTVYTTSPSSEEAQAYQEATTGANRIPYAGNNYLKAYQAVLAMIKAGGPTQ